MTVRRLSPLGLAVWRYLEGEFAYADPPVVVRSGSEIGRRVHAARSAATRAGGECHALGLVRILGKQYRGTVWAGKGWTRQQRRDLEFAYGGPELDRLCYTTLRDEADATGWYRKGIKALMTTHGRDYHQVKQSLERLARGGYLTLAQETAHRRRWQMAVVE